jgi:hypothetical protein
MATQKVDATTPADWQPRFVLDLTTARGRAFEEITHEFEKWRTEHPLPPLDLEDGWHTITPQKAEELLKRNPVGANRKAVLSTVLYYAAQMKRGDWPKTGEAITFKDNGDLLNGQHRLWASYLSGTVFTTYVVTNVPDHPRLFAYVDNGRVRSAANALQTSGMNGVSALIVKVLDAAYAYENDLYTVNSVRSHERMSPVQYMDSLEAHPNARVAAKRAVGDYPAASALADREVVAFATMVLLDLYGDDITDKFFNELGGVEDTAEDGAVEALRKLLQKEAAKLKSDMKKHQKLGNVIKAFNLWIANENPKKNWALRVDEDFPYFAEPSDDTLSEAAA